MINSSALQNSTDLLFSLTRLLTLTIHLDGRGSYLTSVKLSCFICKMGVIKFS